MILTDFKIGSNVIMKKEKIIKNIGIIILILIAIIVVWFSFRNILIDKKDIGTLSDFIIASVAFVALFFGSKSLIEWGKTEKQKQETEKTKQEDIKNIRTERLSDKKIELAVEILEEFHNTKFAIYRITAPLAYMDEVENAKKKIEEEYIYIKSNQNIIFYDRFIKEIETINKLLGLSIKAKIYFGRDVQDCFQKIKEITDKIFSNIQILMSPQMQNDDSQIRKYHHELFNIFSNEEIEPIITDVEKKLLPYIR